MAKLSSEEYRAALRRAYDQEIRMRDRLALHGRGTVQAPAPKKEDPAGGRRVSEPAPRDMWGDTERRR